MPMIIDMGRNDFNILSIDDEPAVHRMMNRVLFRAGYNLLSAGCGEEAFQILAQKNVDLILLDLNMPGLSGFQVSREIKCNPKTASIPIIMMTGQDTASNHVRALEIGVDDFISKTAEPVEIIARIRSHLKIKQLNDQARKYQNILEETVAKRTEQLRNASLEIIWRLTAAAEYRDNETGAHIRRMSHYSAAIAKAMGLGQKTVEAILHAAPMHDIGKIGIPDSILLKPGKLNPQEWQIMKQHPVIGANILTGSKIGFVQMGAMIAATHHERWDGSGYPRGLKERQIPLAGRIVALADVFDALTSKRPYKEAFSIEKAHRIIAEQRAMQFDPDVVNVFFTIQDDILKIKAMYQDEAIDTSAHKSSDLMTTR